jgi:hypothetical protein
LPPKTANLTANPANAEKIRSQSVTRNIDPALEDLQANRKIQQESAETHLSTEVLFAKKMARTLFPAAN